VNTDVVRVGPGGGEEKKAVGLNVRKNRIQKVGQGRGGEGDGTIEKKTDGGKANALKTALAAHAQELSEGIAAKHGLEK